MEYEGQICRATMERSAYKLPVMVGCRYNKCKFCDLFKHLKFRVIPIEEVTADIKRVYDSGGRPRKIYHIKAMKNLRLWLIAVSGICISVLRPVLKMCWHS